MTEAIPLILSIIAATVAVVTFWRSSRKNGPTKQELMIEVYELKKRVEVLETINAQNLSTIAEQGVKIQVLENENERLRKDYVRAMEVATRS